MKALLLIFTLLMVGSSCTQSPLSSSGSSPGSSTLCSGQGGISPPPTLPTSYKVTHKVQIPWSKFGSKVIAGSPLMVMVDHQCTLTRKQKSKSPTKSDLLSEELRDASTENFERAHLQYPIAHSWKNQKDLSKDDLEQMADNDDCVLSISENVEFGHFTTSLNDTFIASMAHLTEIDAFNAYDVFYASSTGISTDVVVSIIDDGTDITHNDISANIWTNPIEVASNSVDDDSNGYVDDVNGYNFASNIPSPLPQSSAYHGTHVAGLTAARANNSYGVAGVIGRNVKVMALNVFGTSGTASLANIINAVNYAAAKRVEVMNMSLGGSGTSTSLQTALQNAVAAGSLIFAAAGNSAQEITSGNFVFPAGYAAGISGMISIGSTDITTDAPSSFTNYSTTYVELGAPGSNATTGGLLSLYPGNAYIYLQGTSMASPVAAGAGAIAISYAKTRGLTLTPAQMENIILGSADTNTALANHFTGGRMLNLKKLADSMQCQ